jgi:hypothetical protein
MKSCLSLLACLALVSATHAQKTFTVNGTINVSSGKAILAPMNNSAFYPGMPVKDTVEIQDGKFTFTGPCTYPLAFQLVVNRGWVSYTTPVFLVEPGTQTLGYNIDNPTQVAIANKSMADRKELLFALYSIDHRIDSVKSGYKAMADASDNHLPMAFTMANDMRQDSLNKIRQGVLAQYISAHSGSYAALWEVIASAKAGYDATCEATLKAFSSSLRRTYTARTLSTRLSDAKDVAMASSGKKKGGKHGK